MKARSELRWTEQVVMMKRCACALVLPRLGVCVGGTCKTCDGNPAPACVCMKALVEYKRRLRNEKWCIREVEPGS
jgi:hypothetical protein